MKEVRITEPKYWAKVIDFDDIEPKTEDSK